MAFMRLLLSCSLIILVTSMELKGSRNHGRQSKLLSFDSVKNDIDVSLDFTVPFMSIPIKKTINSMFNGLPGLTIPKININPSSLAFGSFIILASSILLPLFSNGLSTYHTDHHYREAKKEEPNIVMDFTNQFMSVSRGCPPRIACWMSQRNSHGMVHAKTMDQIIRNKLVSSIFNGTVIEEALIQGKRGGNCDTYEPCPISEEHLPNIIRNFDILTSRKFT